MPSEQHNTPVAEWPRKRLERHKQMLEKKQHEIQGRIDAIDSVLADREPEVPENG